MLALLGGCAATPAGPTAPGGAAGATGVIEVRDARFAAAPPRAGGLVHPAGGDAPVVATIVNTGSGLDRLTGVSSPVATAVTIAGETALPGGSVLAVGYPPGTDVRPAENLPATAAARISATGLREPLRVGPTYPVTFVFERAGRVTLELPVAGPDTLPPRAEPG